MKFLLFRSRMRLPYQIVLAMRLTVFLLIALFLHVSATSSGQLISMKVRQADLTSVFSSIEKQTGYAVFFNKEYLENAKPVTVDVTSVRLEDFLTLILTDQPVTYEINQQNIVIKRRDAPVPATNREAIEIPPAPAGEIRGHVKDSLGGSLAGASISVKGSGKGTETDGNGNFVLANVKSTDILVVSFTGFLTREIQPGDKTFINIVLNHSTDPLDQVQVIAYGTQTQRFNVGSVSTVTSKDIEQQPVTNPLQALQGRAPGLTITSTNGAPGASVIVQIRGQNTLSSVTNFQNLPFDQPLFIIDGVPFATQNQNVNQNQSLATSINAGQGNPYGGISPFNSINPADIESITVLKDADATSIYGSQGSNGVILITTKKGKPGKTKLNVTFNSGTNIATSPVTMMNTQQYLQMRKEAFLNDSLTPSADANDQGFAPDLTLLDQTKYTNWYKYFEGGMANTTNAMLGLSGGSVNDIFYLSGGYTRSGYNFPGNYADNRLSLHSVFKHLSTDQRLNVEFGLDYSYDQNNSSGSPNVLLAFTLPPNYPDLLDKQGNLVWTYNGLDMGSYTAYWNGVGNPLSYLKQNNSTNNYNLNAHLNISYKLANGLSIGSNFGYNWFTNNEHYAYPMSSLDPLQYLQNYAVFATDDFKTLDITPQINYHKNLFNGELKILLGGEYKKNISSETNQQGQFYSNDALLGSINGAAQVYSNDGYSVYKYGAAFARLGYIWKSKYILDLTGRRDGSSNFGPGHKFGNFGSVAGGWIISEEPWLKKLSSISFSKLSGSYGTSGGDGITPYQYQPNWTTNGSNTYQGIRPLYPTNLFNPDYSWSLTKKLNIGLDLGLLHDRFLLNVTWYRDRINKQLISSTLPGQTGFSGVLQNFPAAIQNQGWEFSITTRNIRSSGFSWTSTFNISANVNTLIAFPGLATSPYNSIYKIGESVSSQYVWKSNGVNPTTGLFEFLGADGKPTYDPVHRQASGLNDQYVKEDPAPRFTGGFNNTFTYKSFSLTIFLQGAKQKGHNYLYSVYTNWIPGVYGINQPVQVTNAWHHPGDIATIQRYSTAAANQAPYNAGSNLYQASNTWSDASYLRVKTVSFAYSLPSATIKKWGLQNASLYINAQNLFTITPYQVGDPESQSLYNFPMQKTIVAGINLTF